MPRLGTIPLVAANTSQAAGVSFSLPLPASSDALISVEGADIEVREGQRTVVARFQGVGDAAAAFAQGHRLVQQGLDLLSVLGKLDAVIHDAEDDHVLWWTERSDLVLRAVSTSVLKLGVGPATVIVRDKDGNVIPPIRVQPRHHTAFRYYRLDTDDRRSV